MDSDEMIFLQSTMSWFSLYFLRLTSHAISYNEAKFTSTDMINADAQSIYRSASAKKLRTHYT